MTIINKVSNKTLMPGITPIPDVPDAPTIGAVTDSGDGTTATVAYTAAVTGGTVTTFTATSTPGSFTGTGSSPISVTGLTAGTAYTFKVKGTNSTATGPESAASSSLTLAFAPSFDSIATATGSGSTSITFSSIPQTYKHLQLRILARSTGAGDGRDLNFTANGVTSSGSYKSHHLIGNGSSAYSAVDNSGSTTSAQILQPPASGMASNIFGAGVIDILDYTNTNKNKVIRVLNGVDTNGGTYQMSQILSGLFLSTNAISSITLTFSLGNFATGSSVALYGIKG